MAGGASMFFDIFGRDKGVTKMFDNVAKKAGGLGPIFEGAGALVGKLAGPLAAIGVGMGIKKFVDSSVESFEHLAVGVNGLKRVMGGSTESVSAMRGAMQLAGVNVDDVGVSIGKFSKALGLAEGSGKASAAMVKTLGFDFRDAHGHAKPMAELLPQLADKFKSMPDGAQKTALSMQLFGKSGTQMIPFLNKGSAGIAELEGKAKSMGLTLDDTSIKIMAAGKKSARDFAASIQGMKVQVGQDIAPIMESVSNLSRAAIGPLLTGVTHLFETAREPMLHFAETIEGFADRTHEKIGKVLERLGMLATNLKAGMKMPTLSSAGITGPLGEALRAGQGIGRVYREIAGPVRAFFAAFKDGGNDITSSGIAGKFEAFGLKARAGFDSARQAWTLFADGLKNGSALAAGGLGGLAATAGNALHTGFGQAKAGAGEFFASLKSGAAGGGSGIAGIAGTIGAGLHNVFAAIGPLIPTLLQLWQNMSPVSILFHALMPVLPQLAGLLGQLAATLAGSLGAALTQLMPALQGVAAALVGAFGQILPVVLTAIAGLLPIVIHAFMGLIPVVLQIVQAVIPLIGQILPILMNLFRQIIPIVLQLVTAILPALAQIFGVIISAIGPLISLLAAVLIPIIKALLPVIVIVFTAIASIITAVMKIVSGVIQVVLGLITGNWSMVWHGIVSIFSGVWQLIVAVVSGAIGVVGSVIAGGLGMAAGLVGGILRNIGSFFASTWSNVIGGVSGFIGNLLGFFSGLPGQIMGYLAGAGSWLYNAGRNIIDGLINGVQSMMGAIGNAILSLVPGPIVGVFKDALGIHSPSRVFHELGKNIPQGLIGGISAMVPDINARMSSLVPATLQLPALAGTGARAGAGGGAGAGGIDTSTPGLHIGHITVNEAETGGWQHMGNNILQAAQVQAPRVFA